MYPFQFVKSSCSVWQENAKITQKNEAGLLENLIGYLNTKSLEFAIPGIGWIS
jgi:hypothetical protein